MTTHSLRELNEFLRRVIAINLPDAIWLSAEIAQVGRSRGHYYIDLVEKDELSNQIIAQSQAILWARNHQVLKLKIGKQLDSILHQGMAVLIKVKADYNERYGLSLQIEDIDPAYTEGQLALKRRATIAELKSKGLLNKNKNHVLPTVIQRIAIISSERAAGYQDFISHLATNEYGYDIHYQLFSAAMQGELTEAEVEKALRKIQRNLDLFDAVAIIRGGGAKLDLAAFDSLVISKAIATFPLPIITGIGHEIDETVADLVAHTRLKTPTAVADFLITKMVDFESTLKELELRILTIAQQKFNTENLYLEQLVQSIQLQSQLRLNRASQMIEYIEQEIPKLIKYKLRNATQQLENLEHSINLLSPEYTLQRGFTMTLKDGKPIRPNQLEIGDTIDTVFQEGKITSKVTNNEK